jgi:hypothetical protein
MIGTRGWQSILRMVMGIVASQAPSILLPFCMGILVTEQSDHLETDLYEFMIGWGIGIVLSAWIRVQLWLGGAWH